MSATTEVKQPVKSCLICGQLRKLAVWDGLSGVGACGQCRDARHAISGGAVRQTPRADEEFYAAIDRVMQHYLGDDAPEYGDARYLVDYALTLKGEIQRSAHTQRSNDDAA